jgi:hypothetical protein
MAAPAMLVVLPLSGCDLPACESLDLRATQSRALLKSAVVNQQGAVLAVSDRGNIEVLRECATDDECELRKLSLELPQQLGLAEQLMLTASGRWLIYHSGSEVRRRDVDACIGEETCDWKSVAGEIDIDELIGTLRGGDWIIYRNTNNQLRAVHVGDEVLEGESDFALGSGLDLRVVGLGYRHVVARQSRGDGTEELYLLRVAPALKVDEFGSTTIGKGLLLATGPAFHRVLITEGPSPAEREDPQEFQHDVPTDAQVIATSGEGPDARTLIYDVSNLNQIANFAGEVVTKHAVLEDVPGLSAVSPDGSHLAYLTSDGGLALRNLESQRSCLIKSSDSATHVLAGFAADATLYFEAEEEAYLRGDNTGYERQDVENIHTYDPLTETFTALTTPETDPRVKVWRLRAVPPRHHQGQPWAVAGSNGEYIVKPDAKAESLNYVEARFLPRSNEAGDLWVIEAESESRLNVHRLTPDVHEQLEVYQTQSTVCVSSSPSAGWIAPWATRCSDAKDPEAYLDSGLPGPEQGP